MRYWVRYRLAFQVMFYATVALGLYLGMRPTPPPVAFSGMAVLYHAGGLFTCTILSYLGHPRWHWWVRLVLMSAVGLAVEMVQSLYPTRSADIYDLYANSIGVAVGLAAIWFWRAWSRRHFHSGVVTRA
ncbi:VanZ family protein [Pseudomonas profundi]|uniref:VanZ family protein n=1 Tax=Pseudomonas profundi TaxID=1981513 RepID=UPI001680DC26|nr:VanZ family protein [Pseudomonas profundi]